MFKMFFLFFIPMSIFCSPLEDLEYLLGSSCLSWYQQGERWNFENRYENHREEVLVLLDSMGFFETKQAQKNHYRYGVILGALQPRVQDRINFLIKQWERGVRFEEIVFLTGQRALHPLYEKDFIGYESDMMILL